MITGLSLTGPHGCLVTESYSQLGVALAKVTERCDFARNYAKVFLNDHNNVGEYTPSMTYTIHHGNMKLFEKMICRHRYFRHSEGLVQYCRNSIANALELLHSCTKPSTYSCIPGSAYMSMSTLSSLVQIMTLSQLCYDKLLSYTDNMI